MPSDRSERIQELFAAALERHSDQWSTFLAGATDDQEVRAEVLSLLRAHEGEGPLDRISASAADLIAGVQDRLRVALGRRYRVEQEIGRGGMAIVYVAQDLKHHRRVAVKVLRPEVAAAIGRERFLREIDIAAKLSHPNILPLLDSGEADGLLYYMMPYVAGETLRDRLNREQQLPLVEAIATAREVADALSYAHSLGVIHRDIKPENLLYSAGHALVSDFGIARALDAAGHTAITATGMAIGTPAYMSPEQASGGRVIDARSDIYSLGCVVYELLGGQPPFTGTTPRAVLARHTLDPVPSLRALRPSVSPAVEEVIERALAKVPADRYATARELSDALERALATPSQTRRGSTRRRRQIVIAAMVTVALGGTALWLGIGASGPRIQRLAVLPLANFTNDAEEEYLVHGVHEALISELQQAGMTVIARTSVMQYRSAETPVRVIARELRVDAVIEGSVLRAGDTLQIEVRLVRGRTEEALWRQTYRTHMRNVVGLYRDVTRAIAREIRTTVTPQAEARLAKAPTVNPQAHDAYLRGRFHSSLWTEAAIEQARGYFRQSIRLDTNYALAYVGLAQTYIIGPFPRDSTARAVPLVDRALQLDSGLAEAHAALAGIKFRHDRDWPGADAEFRRALELNPSYAEAHHLYSHLLLALGRNAESLIASQRALSLDTRSPAMTTHLGVHYIATREYDLAIEQYHRALALDPTFAEAHFQLGWALLAKGEYQEAIARLEGLLALRVDPVDLALLGYAYARGGRPFEARRMLGELQKQAARHYVPSYYLALLHVGLGQTAESFQWLERAYEDGEVFMSELTWNPLWDSVRADRRFASLLQRMNLPA
jgi:serine/threonine-protein kinase